MLISRRDIELNPVRAKMIDDPGNYRRSSYRSNGLSEADALLLSLHPLYLALGTDHVSRPAAYRNLFRHPLDAEALAEIRLAVRQSTSAAGQRAVSGHHRADDGTAPGIETPRQTEEDHGPG